MESALKRPTTIGELLHSLSGFSTDQSRQYGLDYQPSSADTFIATYPKCGTTWMQQLVHCMKTGGDMNFSEITDVVPWLEMSHLLGVDNNAAQKAGPKCFKTHFSWAEIPKGGRYIHVTRDPEAVLLSFYRFFEGWFFEPGSIDPDTFAEHFFFKGSDSGLYWNHINEWWPVRDREDVLFLCYENMIKDPVSLIKSVSDFIEINLDDQLLEIILENASADFMREHASQFDDHPIKLARNFACGLPEGGVSSKISLSENNRMKTVLSQETRGKLEQTWKERVTVVSGLDSYNTLLRKSMD
jgi:hypothetical protein